MQHDFLAGAAIRDITPTPELFPMTGASPFGKLTKALDTGAVRALALQSGEKRVLLVAEDSIGVLLAEQTRDRIAAATGLDKKDIYIFATHAHATPFVGTRPSPDFPPENPTGTAAIFLQRFVQAVVDASAEALQIMRPAKMGIGYGKSYINVNRNQDFTSGNMLGVNPEGPSDKTAAVVRFEDEAGKPIAFLLNYAVHAVIMHCNRIDTNDPDAMGYSTDLPGYTSVLFEKKYPGSVALWTSGAAGDQNPIFMVAPYFPDPESGAFRATTISGGGYELLQVAACRHFDDLRRINETITANEQEIEIANAEKPVVLPGRTVIRDPGFENRHQPPKGYVNEGTYEVPMRVCKIGPLKLCCISGELYTTLSQAIRSVSENTLVLTHCMDGYGYLPDDEAIHKHSFGAEAPYQPGYAAKLFPENYQELLESLTK